jgi:hypothetical protein
VEAPITRTIAAIFFIWAGLLIGVSFVATPAKFLAPSLALAQALDVGRWTFYVLAWIEWGFVSVVAALLVTTRQPGRGYMRLLIFSAVVLVTAILPPLARAQNGQIGHIRTGGKFNHQTRDRKCQ